MQERRTDSGVAALHLNLASRLTALIIAGHFTQIGFTQTGTDDVTFPTCTLLEAMERIDRPTRSIGLVEINYSILSSWLNYRNHRQ